MLPPKHSFTKCFGRDVAQSSAYAMRDTLRHSSPIEYRDAKRYRKGQA